MTTSALTHAEKGGRFDLLLDRLRSKASSLKPFPELSRSMRQTLMDRRFALDSAEKAILQKCLDRFQERIPVRTAAGMAERLETVGRKIGLKFMGAPVHGCYYLSTEMFYVEINIDAAGNVNEAKIHHIVAAGADGSGAAPASKHPETQNCPEIIECLSRGDFGEFVAHLEGLVAVYSLGAAATAVDKSRAWQALSCAEQDLRMVFNSYRSWYSTNLSLVHATRIGLLHPRTGGLPLKLRYFLPPEDLVAGGKALAAAELTEAVLVQRDFGLTVTLMLEKSEGRGCLMPTKSLVTNLDTNGVPILGDEMSAAKGNCVSLPARFVLKMNAPMVVSLHKCREIEKMTGFPFADDALAEETAVGASVPLMQAIVKRKSKGQLDGANNRGLFVTLPDQQHCYFLTDLPGSFGVVISSIPFSHPSNVPVIIDALRQQANFNAVVESCVRVNSLQDLDKSIMFELSYTDLKHVSVTFEHPSEDCIATIEMDLGNVDAGPSCKIFTSSETSACPEATLGRIMKRSLSVPIAMRAVIRHSQGKRGAEEAYVHHNGNSSGLASTVLNGNSFGGGGSVGMPDHVRLQNDGRSIKAEDTDKGGGSIGVGGSGGIEVKTEPMEFEFSGRTSYVANAASLNEYGPRDTALNPEAGKPNLKSTAKPSSSATSSSTTSKLSSVRRDPIKQEFQLTKMKDTSASNAIGPQADIKPSVSIIPLAGHDLMSAAAPPPPPSGPSSAAAAATKKSSMSSSGGGAAAAGFEIIPLLEEKSLPGSSSSSRDIKRSLSEDDSRTSKKPKKRKHESSSRMSGSSEKKNFLSSSTSSSPDKLRKSGASATTSPDKLTSAVIDRLAQSSADTGIEILPAPGPNVVGKVGSDGREKSGGRSGDSGSNNSGIKLTIKTPSKYYSSKDSSSSSSSSSKSRSSSSFSSSSSSQYSGSKSSSSSYSDGRSKHSSSKYSSSSSSHRHSSQSSKDKGGGGGSGGGGSGISKFSSSSSSSERDKKKGGGGSDGGSRYSSSSTSSSSHKEKEKQREEEVKKLFGGKLNKTFQIPKLSKGSSPSQKTPTTSPKYASISPKQQQQQPSSSYAPGASPNYIGGGSATPPTLSSPKHPYSAPNSVPGVTRSSPLQATSPKTSSRTTPSQSPTYIGGGSGGAGGGGGRQQVFSAPGLPLSRPPGSGGQDEGGGPN